MTLEEFNELKAALAELSEHDVQLARALNLFLMLLVRALPVQEGV